MLNQFIILINILGIFFISFFTDQDISVKLNTPTEVQAGQEFEVQLVIDKGSIESYSRFIQELPYGLTANRISTANADFSFENQRLRLLWVKLPPDSQIVVTYSISVHSQLKGTFNLGGEFAFTDENERHAINVQSENSITIIPDPNQPENLLVDINDTEKVQEVVGTSNVPAVKRSKPEQMSNRHFKVNLTINKAELEKYAKIEEFIPEGFRAIECESKEGIFSFGQGVVKILWMNLPDEKEFEVCYYIIPDLDKSIDDLNLRGTFSYITGNKTEAIQIVQMSEVPEDYFASDSQDIKTDLTDNTKPPVDTSTDTSKDIQTDQTNDEIVVDQTVKDVSSQTDSDILQAEEGIYYRVQLAAGHSKINISNYFSRKNVKDKVKMEQHEGWNKYTTGSFSIYKDARDYRVKIWETTPIKDAFVSAYDSGRRITVQEALMVTNQRWYR